MTPVVLHTGALIALERRDPAMASIILTIARENIPTYVPAGVIAQVWRNSPRQHDIMRLLNTEVVNIDILDRKKAFEVGALLAQSGTSDIVDAHVALLAQRLGAIVYTSDPQDIERLNANLKIVAV